MTSSRTLVIACCALMAACSARAVLQDASGTLRVVAQEALPSDATKAAECVAKLLAQHESATVVVALDAMAWDALRAANPKSKDDRGLRVVAIGDSLPSVDQHSALDSIIVATTGAAVAVDLALLASHGIELPKQVALGTRTVTAANAAAGGAPRLAPGDLGMEMLRRQHTEVLTTTPSTDVIFKIALVQMRAAAGFDERLREEVKAASKRYPQLELVCYDAAGDATRFVALVTQCITENLRAVLLSADDWSMLASIETKVNEHRYEQKIALIALDPMVAVAGATCSVGSDQAILGRAAGEALRALLPTGGDVLVLSTQTPASRTAARLQGFVDALGLRAN